MEILLSLLALGALKSRSLPEVGMYLLRMMALSSDYSLESPWELITKVWVAWPHFRPMKSERERGCWPTVQVFFNVQVTLMCSQN